MTRAVAVVLSLLLAGCAGDSIGGDRRSAPQATATLPAGDVPRFAVIGDFGTGEQTQYDVAARMCARHDRRPFPIVITTGDNVYPDGDPARFDVAFFRPYGCLFDKGVRFHASLGNHDVLTRNGWPEVTEPAFGMKGRRYVVKHSGVRFVLADSTSLDREWLRGALTADPGDLWTVVAFHHPVYSSGTGHGSTPGMRPWMPRLFARKGVDLVLNGHDHIYSVSKPLRRIRYVVTGGGGAGLYGCTQRWFTAACEVRHHFLEVTVKDAALVIKAIPIRGRAFHTFRTAGR